MNSFYRFPHTPHLAWLGQGEPRGDKVLSSPDVRQLLAGEVVIEEKLDGANLGISLGGEGELRVQNRGSYLSQPYRGQFSRMASWLAERDEALTSISSSDLILFGEWCAATHTIPYDHLPDWFLLFDIYSSTRQQFLSTTSRNALAQQANLSTVPEIARGKFTLSQLTDLLLSSRSRYREGPVEGLIVRRETETTCFARAKLVRPDFTQAIQEHWSARPLRWNRVVSKRIELDG